MNLNKEFNIEENNIEVKIIEEDENLIPENIIKNNIQKTQDLLDLIIEHINSGSSTARMFEVAGKLADVINSSAMNLIMAKNTEIGLDIKQQSVDLKEKEIEIKKMLSEKPDTINQNLIVTSRNEILKLLETE